MKKTLSILLALLLALSLLPAGALAADVVLSNQNLRVDGKVIQCEKYNIDGSNYFKLRDLAYVLNGTGSQFSVSWDGENKCVSLVTGEAYEPNGSELDLSGGDKSASAAPSGDAIIIDGVLRSDLSAYKLEGNNFFKLKDLGEALGFKVGYDAASRTMIVNSYAFSVPTPWRTAETFWSDNQGSSEHCVETFDEDGRSLSYLYDSTYYTELYTYAYNDLGNMTRSTYDYSSKYDGENWEEHSVTEYTYDLWGLQTKKTTTVQGSAYADGPEIREETLTYDDMGLLIRDETLSSYGSSVSEYTYDERGNRIKAVSSSDGSVYNTIEYAYDGEGRVIRSWSTNADGVMTYSSEYEYAGGLLVKETYTSESYSYVATCTYDERGNLLNRHNDTSDWDTDTTYEYDEADRMVKYVYYDGADLFTSTYTYDDQGNLLRTEYTSPDYDYVEDYTYDAEGNCLTDVYTGSDYNYRTEYSYDREAGKKTVVTAVEYPAAAELVISETELTLAVGDESYLYTYFLPYSSASETVTWTSSDDSIVDVDGEGNLFARAAGAAVVTATSENGLTASCTVTVVKDKYTLHLDSTSLTVEMGQTGTLHCDAEVAGVWKTYFISHDGNTNGVCELKWSEWNGNSCDLFITPLRTGQCTIKVWLGQRSDNGDINFEPTSVTITVTDGNTASKP